MKPLRKFIKAGRIETLGHDDSGVITRAAKAALEIMSEAKTGNLDITEKAIETFGLNILKELWDDDLGDIEARKQLRLIGNWIRMCCSTNEQAYRIIEEINIGFKARNCFPNESGEKEAIEAIARYLESKSCKENVIFDVGANTGEWSSLLLKTMQNPLVLHIFEPNTTLTEELRKNLLLNTDLASHHRLQFNEFGISELEQSTTLFVNDLSNELATIHELTSRSCYEKISKQEIKLLRGDQYCKQNAINNIDLLKIDVEGGELEVLKSFNLNQGEINVSFIQFEYGIANFYAEHGLKDFFECFSEDFIFAKLLPEGISIAEKYNNDIEDFEWSNYLGINKREVGFFNFLQSQV